MCGCWQGSGLRMLRRFRKGGHLLGQFVMAMIFFGAILLRRNE